MIRKLLPFLALLFFSVALHAQPSFPNPVRSGPSLPATCTPGGLVPAWFLLTAGGPIATPYYCSATNTWTAASGGGGASPCGALGQVQLYATATTFGCDPQFLWDTTAHMLEIGNNLGAGFGTLVNQSSSDSPPVNAAPIILSWERALTLTGLNQSDISYETDTSLDGTATDSGGFNHAEYYIIGGSVTQTTNSGVPSGSHYAQARFSSSSTAQAMAGDYGSCQVNSGTVTDCVGVWATVLQFGGTLANAKTFYAQKPTGTVGTLNAAYFNDNFTGVAGAGKDFSWYSQGGTLHAETGSATTVGQEIERFSGQSANLWQLLDSDGTTVLAKFDSSGNESIPKETITGNVVNPFIMIKNTQSATAPAAGNCDLRWIAGTNMGTGKIVAACGTSATEVVIADNVGAGF